jgi:hypothetical protein
MKKIIDPTPFPLDPPVSICPAGECFPLPNKDDEAAEFSRLQKLVTEQWQLGREIVVVMGVGFVGAVMACTACSTKRPFPPTTHIFK